MAKVIELNRGNLRYIRKYYFNYTLETVARITKLSVCTIRHAELGLGVKESTLNRLYDFYMKAEQLRRELRAKKSEASSYV